MDGGPHPIYIINQMRNGMQGAQLEGSENFQRTEQVSNGLIHENDDDD